MEFLEGFPENVVAVSAKGKVTKSDYEAILIPAAERAFQKHGKIRFYYRMGSEFLGLEPGAAWEDFKVGISHWQGWERVAVVTDVEWIRHAAGAFAFLMPAQVRAFPVSQEAEARGWITGS